MEADNEVLERKSRETEAMRQRVVEMEEVKEMMEKQVKDYTIYEVRRYLEAKASFSEGVRNAVCFLRLHKYLNESDVLLQDYLMAVVHNYPEFKQPLDVLNRYEALGKCPLIAVVAKCYILNSF